jgi:hypothetical protein
MAIPFNRFSGGAFVRASVFRLEGGASSDERWGFPRSREFPAQNSTPVELKRRRMARIAGVNIPTNKRVEIALTYIHGIGRTTAKKIVEKLASRPSGGSRT